MPLSPPPPQLDGAGSRETKATSVSSVASVTSINEKDPLSKTKEEDATTTSAVAPAAPMLLSLQLANSKRQNKKHRQQHRSVADQLQVEQDSHHDKEDDATTTTPTPPLVIPVQQNTMIRLQPQQQDAAAVRALEAGSGVSMTLAGGTARSDGPADTIPLITTTTDTHRRKNDNDTQQQYRTAVEQLPAPLSTTDAAYARVPIASFGAAVLRGMGWQEETGGNDDPTETEGKHNKKEEESILPRPHRLGLGAVPKQPVRGHRRRPRRMDEYERDQRQAQQYTAVYEQQTQQQRLSDPQRTLQHQSIVHVRLLREGSSSTRRQRARVVQLHGVPGLNRVRVRLEGCTTTTIDIPKKRLDGLVRRSELEQTPWQEEASSTTTTNGGDASSSRQKRCRRRDDDDDNTTSHRKKKKRSSQPQRHQQHDRTTTTTWIIPNICVRIVSKRYGKEYYKEKAVVIDVTSAGATLQLLQRRNTNTHSTRVLDGVPETHLETALPPVGGKCILVVSSNNNHRSGTKGRLLERNSRTAILQESENGTALTVELDDIAEWCGELEDD